MSYLDVPRINFAGEFYANPSTVNNDPDNYKAGVTDPPPWQEPYGNHDFSLWKCKVVSALDDQGNDVGDDLIIAAEISSVVPHALTGPGGQEASARGKDGTPAKLVDVDVYQQATSAIYGLKMTITLRGGGGAVTGNVEPPFLNSVWFKAIMPERGWRGIDSYGQGSYGGDSNASGWFRTVVRFPKAQWPEGSNVLNQLKAKCQDLGDEIVVGFRMVLDSYVNNPINDMPDLKSWPAKRFGRIRATLGPWTIDEPVGAPGPRWLVARPFPATVDASNPCVEAPKKQAPEEGLDITTPAPWSWPALYGAPFMVDQDRKRLVVDLCNAVPKQHVGGPRADLGKVTALIQPPGGAATPIGVLDTSDASYQMWSGIAELPLTDEQLALIHSNPLHLETDRDDIGCRQLWKEADHGMFVSADDRVHRMTRTPTPGEKPTKYSHVWITRWGQPVPEFTPSLNITPVVLNTPGATVPPNTYPGDTSQADGALTATASASTANGKSVVTFNVIKDPGARLTDPDGTPRLDGQLYFVYAYDPQTIDPQAPPWDTAWQELQISILAWSDQLVNENPTWEQVRAIMQPYAALYPSMRELIDLTDEHSFSVFAKAPPWCSSYGASASENWNGVCMGAIPYFMSRDMKDPMFMPITRDLSPRRRDAVLYYCKNLQGPHGNCPPPEARGCPEASDEGSGDASTAAGGTESGGGS